MLWLIAGGPFLGAPESWGPHLFLPFHGSFEAAGSLQATMRQSECVPFDLSSFIWWFFDWRGQVVSFACWELTWVGASSGSWLCALDSFRCCQGTNNRMPFLPSLRGIFVYRLIVLPCKLDSYGLLFLR